ncbi:Asp-tRNA(Asn)/Glu-tRNA(Gln) amidotransferase subunit GatA [Candidatus Peregrinibacteria bacterium]|nr:MAG: Asp-tRNA(Asn)/Glu-tRNA(Gln) amidotransferase subunit GatA [Candidatus Peregrinibacteria bacterium]
MTIKEINTGLNEKKFSCAEITQEYLDRIEIKNRELNSFITISKERALEEAKQLDANKDFSHPLAGVPMALKDVVCTQGIKTTDGSKMLENFIPPYNAVVADRLKNAGTVLLGKTNTDEFTMGSSNETSYFGPVKNPHNPDYVPGGSSGGSAAAVAAHLATFSIGTDTGGSIRQPASFCGVVGLKVTYGRVPRYGVLSYASSFDTVGPITQTVEDAAIVLNTIAGPSEKDSTTPAVHMPDYTQFLKTDLKGVKVGVPKEFFAQGVDPSVIKVAENAIETLRQLGAELVEINLPMTEYAIPTYYILVKSEASSNMSRYDGIKYGHATDHAKELEEVYLKSRAEGFGDEVKRAIMLGTYALSAGYYDAYYLKAAKVRNLIKQEYEAVFQKCDVMIGPVSPIPPFKIGEKIDDPISMYLADTLSVPMNLAGICGLALPAGKSENGLPIGIQLMANQFKEENLFHVGHAFEQANA